MFLKIAYSENKYQIGSNWIKLDQIGSNWTKSDQIGSNFEKAILKNVCFKEHGLNKTWS